MVDLLRALPWQYDATTAFRSLATQKQAWYEAYLAGFWSDWFRDVFNLQTANSFGLSVWSIVLDLPLPFAAEDAVRPSFGFDPYDLPFDQSNFGQDGPGGDTLTVEQRRLALRLRYFQLISDGTVPTINAFLADLFKASGPAYVLDDRDMTCRFIFEFEPDPLLFSVITDLGLLPRPAGVEAFVLTAIPGGAKFGFEPFYKPFDQGTLG